MFRGYRFDLHPTPGQAETLGQWVGVTRLIYNVALEQRRDFWRQYLATEGMHISMPSQSRELTALRAEFDWISAVPATIQGAALNDLDRAYKDFFKGKSAYPSARRSGQHDSMRFGARDVSVRQLNAKWAEVRLPKVGWVRFRSTRPITGALKTMTLTRRSGKWSAAFTSDIGDAPAQISALPAVGIDRGVVNTLTLSTGEHIRLPDPTALERRKRKAQRVLSRRKRGSVRYAKQRRRVASIAAKIARVRSNALHVASADIARRFGVVALEDLKVAKMTRRARGSGAKQKAGLNRSILAQGWTAFAAMVEYKLEATGGRVVYVPAAHTSQTCAACGVIDPRSRKSQAVFRCVHCGHEDHADINAALEISRRSTSVLSVEGRHVRRPVEAETWAA